MKALGRQSFLVVFDFDHTVVDCNTDEVIPAALGRGDDQRLMVSAKDRMQWTNLMDTLIAPFSKEELVIAADKSVKIDPHMQDVFRYLMEAQDQYVLEEVKKEKGKHTRATAVQDNMPNFLEINIASDANLLFIEAALDARLCSVKERVSQIHSNPYYDLTAPDVPADAGLQLCFGPDRPLHSRNVNSEAERDAAFNADRPRKSRVCWYEPHGHQCECCMAGGKPNMCKSLIIERLLQTTNLIDPTIIFIGDGGNDYCPVLNVLRPRDYIFARRDFPLHRILCGMDGHSGGGSDVGGCCHVGLWRDAQELKGLFTYVLERPGARLPTLVRFRDASLAEFRTVTMANRIPAVLKRTLEDSRNAAVTSAAGRQRVLDLIQNAEQNGLVPPLPGQTHVPAWLRNYAYVSECDRVTSEKCIGDRVPPPTTGEKTEEEEEGSVDIITPRWGQIPWLHGEIYFYHLLWQYLMMRESDTETDNIGAAAAVQGGGACYNAVTPYALSNPLFSQQCDVSTTSGMVSEPIIPLQSARDAVALLEHPEQLSASVIARRVHGALKGKWGEMKITAAKVVPYTDLLRQLCGCRLPPADHFFLPYRDIFAQEKRDVLMQFLKPRVVPMLACQPWAAGPDYGGVLLRWMLWGNGIDLSMFTLDQLTSAHAGGAAAEAGVAEKVSELQEEEEKASLMQDVNLVGHEVSEVEKHLAKLIEPHFTGPRQIDIVNDNVGVEVISDLCFGLWYAASTKHEEEEQPEKKRRVVYHVKPMPYYVSDVTPRDFDLTLRWLEETYTGETAEPDVAKRAALQAVLEPFVSRVRDHFATGVFAVEADTVWTQPSEYRDLPPRVLNRYFYTQHVTSAAATVRRHEAAVVEGANNTPAVAAAGDAVQVLCSLSELSVRPRSALVIFKGDLNYRRLVGDRYWDRSDFLTTLAKEEKSDLNVAAAAYTEEEKTIVAELLADTPASGVMNAPTFKEVMAAYWPLHAVPVCSIRTIKSECCVGVPWTKKSRLDQKLGTPWRITGKYGEILWAA